MIIVQKPVVEAQATFILNEAELRALDALTGYGVDEFLKVFYEKLGEAYLQPHEFGVRTFFECIRSKVPPILNRATAARATFNE